LRDGISGNEVDQKKDEAGDQPDDREGVEDALEYRFQWLLGGEGDQVDITRKMMRR
jgi:hypothetical protein